MSFGKLDPMSLIQQQKAELIADLTAHEPTVDPTSLAIVTIMNHLHCSQDEAFAVLLDELRPDVEAVSEVPMAKTHITESGSTPQGHWRWRIKSAE